MEAFVLQKQGHKNWHDKVEERDPFSFPFIGHPLDFLWNPVYTNSID